MLSELRAAAKVVGVKQSKKVIREGGAAAVFVAGDAEERVTRPILELCQELGVQVTEVPTMQELGRAAGIDVGAAVVVQVQDTVGNAN
ncbi:ribosomal L7Ae/L30e/S12e/Gadd45 family protein [Intestinibacillus massiliensis]|uniref:L7Ae/L30e/S12e/Gadd45 family ribosomal protein n=1 Tax=Intestinibacillus massiliensis TaxID=1871029 RepID=UPI000B34BFB3|nr:ribosomal L7Ae/L30e/S12e/Gadd45 family protein [Intestinibacillus massiliensis]MCB6365240.1 ribosomal L7Ae/L30e/S12e/Gadd45 family protein [Intestinibacillus massiliensis]